MRAAVNEMLKVGEEAAQIVLINEKNDSSRVARLPHSKEQLSEHYANFISPQLHRLLKLLVCPVSSYLMNRSVNTNAALGGRSAKRVHSAPKIQAEGRRTAFSRRRSPTYSPYDPTSTIA